MSISRRIARPLLASEFIYGGIDAIRHPETKVEAAKAVTDPLRDWVPALPDDTATLVRLNGMVQVGAGGLLALGKFPRLASVALIGSIVPTTFAGHRFWEESEDETRAQQRTHFLKNLGLLGGLILAALDTEGAPSIGWKTRRQAERVSHVVSLGRASAGTHGHQVSAQAVATGRKAARKARKATIRANNAAVKGGRRANRAISEAALVAGARATPFLLQAGESAQQVAKAALEGAEAGAQRGSAQAVKVRRRSGRKAKKLSRQANQVAQAKGKRASQALSDVATSGRELATPLVQHAHEQIHHAHEQAHQAAKTALAGAEVGARSASEKASEARRQTRRQAKKAAHHANQAATAQGHRAQQAITDAAVAQGHRAQQAITDAATSGIALAAPHVRQANESIHSAAHTVRENAEPAITAGVERAEELLAKVSDALSNGAEKAS
jgi:uncharacterized membrane protein YphA (DoxX/SURF4 family)